MRNDEVGKTFVRCRTSLEAGGRHCLSRVGNAAAVTHGNFGPGVLLVGTGRAVVDRDLCEEWQARFGPSAARPQSVAPGKAAMLPVSRDLGYAGKRWLGGDGIV